MTGKKAIWVESLRSDPASLVLSARVNILVSGIAFAIAAAITVVRERSARPVVMT